MMCIKYINAEHYFDPDHNYRQYLILKKSLLSAIDIVGVVGNSERE